MQLRELLASVDTLGEDQMICARRPWTLASEAIPTHPTKEWGVPEDVKLAGFEYFLDVHTAREVLGVFEQEDAVDETQDRRIRLLMFYAEYDAFPDWVYER